MSTLMSLFNLMNPWIRWPLIALMAIGLKGFASIVFQTGFGQWQIFFGVFALAVLFLIYGLFNEFRKREEDVTGVSEDTPSSS